MTTVEAQKQRSGNQKNRRIRPKPSMILKHVYIGSYVSAHVSLNLLNEVVKINKLQGLPSILSLFRNEFNDFNNTRARMLDSIYHMTLR